MITKFAHNIAIFLIMGLLLSGGICCILSGIYQDTDLAIIGGSLILLDMWTAFCIWLGGEA